MFSGHDASDVLCFAAGPVNGDALDFLRTAETEMQPLARLGEESFAGAQAARASLAAGQHDDHAGTDGVAVAGGAFELQREPVAGGGAGVAQEPDARGGAIAHPEVGLAVVVPIARRHGPAIVVIAESAARGDIGEFAVLRVEETGVLLMPAEGPALTDEFAERLPSTAVALRLIRRGLRGLR